MAKVKIALVQMNVSPDPAINLKTAAEYIKKAADAGANIAVLPEMFCCLYNSAAFVEHKEPQGGRIWQALCRMAANNKIYLVGGSIPEECSGKIYNTSFVFAPDGVQIGRHRKVHLFDIDVPGGQSFKESDTFTAGDNITVIKTSFGIIGVQICFDIRFQEMVRLMALEGAQMVFVPAAFNMTTGPAHWELNFRSRALDSQIFTIGCSPARDVNGPYVAWGNSIIVSPWGAIINKLDETPGLLLQEIDTDDIEKYRSQLPIMKGRRQDIYEIHLLKR